MALAEAADVLLGVPEAELPNDRVGVALTPGRVGVGVALPPGRVGVGVGVVDDPRDLVADLVGVPVTDLVGV